MRPVSINVTSDLPVKPVEKAAVAVCLQKRGVKKANKKKSFLYWDIEMYVCNVCANKSHIISAALHP